MRNLKCSKPEKYIRYAKEFGLKATFLYFLHYIVFKRGKTGYRIEKARQKEIMSYIWRKYRKYFDKGYQEGNHAIGKVGETLPIYLFWIQGWADAPEVVKDCAASVQKNRGEHPILFLDLTNYKKYCTIPEIVEKKYNWGKIGPANFSDVVRTALLAEKGGIWLDATIFLTREFPQDICNFEFYTRKMHMYGDNLRQSVTDGKWSTFFLASKPQAPLFCILREVLLAYIQCEELFIDYFLIDYIIRIAKEHYPEIASCIDVVPYNNQENYFISKVYTDEFHEDRWKEIEKETYLFKLSRAWKVPESKTSFYRKVISRNENIDVNVVRG